MDRFFHHKHDKEQHQMHQHPQSSSLSPPEFKFIRSDTNSETLIHPPGYPEQYPQQHNAAGPSSPGSGGSGRSRSGSTTQRLRQSLLGHHRHKSETSVNIPDLPPLDQEKADEKAWEERATMLAKGLATPDLRTPSRRSRANSVVSVKIEDDATIQEAIRLHEAQRYTEATQMFKTLANPDGPNNVLSQVLYALSLRHGWGCQKDETKAAEYLRLAASNAADIEEEALRAGMSKGGSAKGELILAIYELANCYRQGWGVPKDLKAAFQYYLTAANLGDTDAMNEVALCYLEGYGTKKDKYEAARYYRLAESKGHKTVGNSWIYKDKYIKYEQERAKRRGN